MSLFEAVEKRFDEEFVISMKDSCNNECCSEKSFCYLKSGTKPEPVKAFFRTEFKTLLEELEKSVLPEKEKGDYNGYFTTDLQETIYWKGTQQGKAEMIGIVAQKIKEFISNVGV